MLCELCEGPAHHRDGASLGGEEGGDRGAGKGPKLRVSGNGGDQGLVLVLHRHHRERGGTGELGGTTGEGATRASCSTREAT